MICINHCLIASTHPASCNFEIEGFAPAHGAWWCRLGNLSMLDDAEADAVSRSRAGLISDRKGPMAPAPPYRPVSCEIRAVRRSAAIVPVVPETGLSANHPSLPLAVITFCLRCRVHNPEVGGKSRLCDSHQDRRRPPRDVAWAIRRRVGVAIARRQRSLAGAGWQSKRLAAGAADRWRASKGLRWSKHGASTRNENGSRRAGFM